MEEYRNLLPKNMRQMGEKEDRVRIYVEDYVCTYFQKLELTTECWRVGVLLGMHEEREGVPCLFISGAVETQAAEYAEGCGKWNASSPEWESAAGLYMKNPAAWWISSP